MFAFSTRSLMVACCVGFLTGVMFANWGFAGAQCSNNEASSGQCSVPANVGRCGQHIASCGPWAFGAGAWSNYFYCTLPGSTPGNKCSTFSRTPGGPIVTAPCWQFFLCQRVIRTTPDGWQYQACDNDPAAPYWGPFDAPLTNNFSCAGSN